MKTATKSATGIVITDSNLPGIIERTDSEEVAYRVADRVIGYDGKPEVPTWAKCCGW